MMQELEDEKSWIYGRRVRSIRASERCIWQQITNIFVECSIDYDKNAKLTHDFYSMVQNKFHS